MTQEVWVSSVRFGAAIGDKKGIRKKYNGERRGPGALPRGEIRPVAARRSARSASLGDDASGEQTADDAANRDIHGNHAVVAAF